MKKKILLYLGIFLSLIFVVVFGVSAYSYYRAIHADDPIVPYIQVEKGNISIVRNDATIGSDPIAIDLVKDEKFDILENDTIFTRIDSEAVIFWPDRSTTYLGQNTKFAIHKMKVARDYSKIEIEASLLEGKSYSNIIRTLYPGSYMNVKLPNQGVVAGVRGTEFSINLEKGYIHSIDHIISLKNNLFQSTTLLPEEIVSTSNIFRKLGKDVLDVVWEKSVALKNFTYEKIHADRITKAWEKIVGNLTTVNYWDVMVRKILSQFSVFEDLNIAARIQSFDVSEAVEIPTKKLMKWYQGLKNGDFAKQRDIIRGALYKISQTDIELQKIFETLATESLWDKIQFPHLSLENTNEILKNYSQKFKVSADGFIENITTRNYGTEMSEAVKKWFQ